MNDDNTDHDRLKKLSGFIAGIRAEEASEKAKAAATERDAVNMNTGVRAGAELVTCFVAGGIVGWLLDHQFGTGPICLIIFLLVGICLGFYEVYRITK